jgi:hypothetical protein
VVGTKLYSLWGEGAHMEKVRKLYSCMEGVDMEKSLENCIVVWKVCTLRRLDSFLWEGALRVELVVALVLLFPWPWRARRTHTTHTDTRKKTHRTKKGKDPSALPSAPLLP